MSWFFIATFYINFYVKFRNNNFKISYCLGRREVLAEFEALAQSAHSRRCRRRVWSDSGQRTLGGGAAAPAGAPDIAPRLG